MAELEGPAHVIQPLDERDPPKADSGILDVLLLAGSSCQRNLLTSRWLLGGRGYYYPLQCAASWKIASDGIILGLAWLEGKDDIVWSRTTSLGLKFIKASGLPVCSGEGRWTRLLACGHPRYSLSVGLKVDQEDMESDGGRHARKRGISRLNLV